MADRIGRGGFRPVQVQVGRGLNRGEDCSVGRCSNARWRKADKDKRQAKTERNGVSTLLKRAKTQGKQ